MRNYGVIFKYFKSDNDFTQIHFETEVTYIGQSENGKHYFRINRKKVFINESAPDLTVEQLAEKAGSCLYPMNISTNNEGPFEEIENFEEINKRWNSKKIELQNYYKGKIAERIIENLDKVYSSKEKLDQIIKKDLFLTLFFMPIYRKHNNRIANYEKRIAFLPIQKSVSYTIVQEVEKYLTDTKKQVIRLLGKSDEEILLEPDLQLDYKIDNETKSIYSIKGSINVQRLKNKIQKVEIQLFQLK